LQLIEQVYAHPDTSAAMKLKHVGTAALAACLLLIIAHGVDARQLGGSISSSAVTAAVGSAAATAAVEAHAALQDGGNRPWFCRQA
jgi:hypothetical protein